MKKVVLPELNADKVFNFHKTGGDSEFENALKKMDGMYDNIFGSETNYDHLFQNLQADNNPMLDPINNMVNDIFDPNDVKDNKQYEMLSPAEAKI